MGNGKDIFNLKREMAYLGKGKGKIKQIMGKSLFIRVSVKMGYIDIPT